MSVNPVLLARVKKALRRKRIPSSKERQRRAKKKGGFDDSWITKEKIKELEKDKYCYWCKQPQHLIVDNVHNTGEMILTCDSDGCFGNYYEKESVKKKTNKRIYGRIIDQKLCMDLGKLLIGRDPGRLWATQKRLIL